MTTGRPRLESSPAGQRILDAIREILADYPDADAPIVAHELRRRGIPRMSGNLNWNDRAARTAMDRVDSRKAMSIGEALGKLGLL